MDRPIEIKKLNIDELINFIETKNLAIPEFQRGYVWREVQVKKLFDSLVRRYPIGSFVIWKTRQRIGQRNLFVKDPEQTREKYLVLDGQQRLLSIYYLCKQSKFLGIKDRFEEVYEHKQKHLIEFEHFYFKDVQNPKLDYLSDKNQEFDFESFKEKLGKSYLFPVIVVSIEDYDRAIDIFERINQTGTSISTASIFLSEAFNKHTNLGKILRKWKEENKNSLSGNIENIVFVHMFSIIVQLEQLLNQSKKEEVHTIDVSLKKLKNIAKEIKEEPSKKYEKVFKKVLEAVSQTMSFLTKEYGIKDLRELPSQTMLSVLSVFFYYNLEKSNLKKRQRKELQKWFWRSALSGRYVGSEYNEHIRRDPIQMKKLAKNNYLLDIPKKEIYFETLRDLDLHTGRSTIKNAVKLMLWGKRPIFLDGSPLNRLERESKKKKKENDHFYPFDWSNKPRVDKTNINSILNLVYLSKDENASKQAIPPSELLERRKSELNINEALIISEKDEKEFFSRNLLPFNSIKELKKWDNYFVISSKEIKPKIFNKFYQKFLKKRFEIFKAELNRLQNGR